MPLPSIVLDTYLRYKNSTKTFVNWLASSARATGTVEDLFTNLTSGRRKGKFQKESKVVPPTNDEPIHIPLSFYDKLANAVVGSSAAIVPKSMLDTLRDAISKREECAAYYRRIRPNKGRPEKISGDVGHAYCISTLKATLEILLCKNTGMAHSEGGQDLTKLPDLEHHAQGRQSVDSTSNKVPAPEDMAIQERMPNDDDYAVEPTKEEAEFAFFCMMKDVTDIRFFVRRTWRKHKAGYITLETAAVTMNAAIQIVEQLNMAFAESFPQHPEFDHHVSLLTHYWKKRWTGGVLQTPGGVQEFRVAYTDGVQEIDYASFSCSRVALMIQELLLTPLEDEDFHDKLPQLFESDIPFAKYEIRFWKTLVQLAIVCTDPVRGIPQDYVLKAMSRILARRKCPTWAVFAMQCVRDTQIEFGTPETEPRRELLATTDSIQLTLVRYTASVAEQNISSWHKMHWQVLLKLHNLMTVELVDNWAEKVIHRRRLSKKGRSFEKDFFLNNHHSMRGLYGQGKLLTLQKWAATMEATHGVIRATAHLYHAAKTVGLLAKNSNWEDMDYYINTIGDDKIFGASRPEREGEFLACFLRSSCYSVSQKALSGRLSKTEVQKVEQKLAQGKGRDLNFLSRYVRACTTIEKGHAKPGPAFDNPKFLLEAFGTRNDKATPCKTPVKSLTELREAVQEDQHRLRFNIMSLWVRCHKLLLSIRDQVMQTAPHDYPESEYGHGLGPMMVAASLLSEYAAFAPIDGPQFAGAVQLMRQLIVSEGSIETKAASDQTRSSTIKRGTTEEEEPSFENPPEDLISFECRKKSSVRTLTRRGKVEKMFFDGRFFVKGG